KRDLYIILDKFCNSKVTNSRNKIYTLLDISLNIYNINLFRTDYRKNLKDTIFNIILFL
ncbi:uncharacterized protein K444DRAFT_488964, partial [Hyaloscypha bicolor E]